MCDVISIWGLIPIKTIRFEGLNLLVVIMSVLTFKTDVILYVLNKISPQNLYQYDPAMGGAWLVAIQ